MRKILILQVLLIAAVTGAYFGKAGAAGAQAALFGGAIALVNALLLGRRVQRAGRAAQDSVTRGTFALYLGAVERFVFTLVGFGVGMGVLHLQPLPLLLAFAAAQAAYWLAARARPDSLV
ncbi:MAG TPA: ATP synthase subunit I [Gammaproteobacteria bacterium]|nr:ATP synthase subunit I [Gammaproteobacteria bacterium]